MRRRAFLGAVASCATIPWLAATAQPARKKLIGMISSFSAGQVEPLRGALLEKLRELGWREGDNLEFDLRLAEPTPSALSAASAALIARGPDLLIAQGNPTLDAMRPHSRTIPVVFLLVADPVELGLVASL